MYPATQHVAPVQPTPPHCAHAVPQFPPEELIVVVGRRDVGAALVVGLVAPTATSAHEL